MANKNSLTRDEAREAIGILALKEENLESAAIVNLGVLLTTLSVLILIIKYNLAPDFNLAPDLILTLIMIGVVLLAVLTILLAYRYAHIDDVAKELAKNHNLKEFYNAVLGRESVRECVDKIIKKLSMWYRNK